MGYFQVMSKPNTAIRFDKKVSFLRNCGAASVGEFNRVNWYYQVSY